MESDPSEQAPEKTAETPQAEANPTTPADSGPGLKEILKPSQPTDELEERRQSQSASGDLGMHIRAAS
jgi:hypothetical protein